ncbi:MAG: cation:proton antiporter regulatory subunit [Dehalobacter sp. 4CP]|jgi:TrkA domain protein|uniref:Potassium:proton antiporter n=2 Tax=Dehalobacter restrictus TaxID=55583 RepID=A0A857DH99_9FIRM|nr:MULTISPECIES: cation:proton antiporter regulatory subunit [Dehalobacter]NBJ16368.1 cation:proton antiporter regulatory subunit [Dehalobacter sp. 4CP]AFV01833.1 trkA domain protein [Dehalobacter sp. DCA]AFV04870.1 TrkA-C domain protein [Dehalobacter sp. CF]AHF10108.1 potassium transporter [Dehalobacter restrictus DSM 9455]EQB20691.1 TrkA-C domain protein [Dehalobacter sp. UNSWDHB]
MKLVKEKDLPGIGKKYQLDTRSGDKLVVIVHDDGRREMYHYYLEDPNESISMVTLDDEESRCIASILGGMAYRPKDLDTVEVAIGDMVLEWYRIETGAYAIGKSIGEMQVRKRTGGTIIAMVKKDQNKTINPNPDIVLQEGATIVILGEKEQVKAAKGLLFHGSVH